MTPTWTSDDGRVELWHGDCLNAMAEIPAESITLLWTDPPYGHGNAQDDFLSRRSEIMADGKRTASTEIANDNRDEMRTVVDSMLLLAVPLLRSDCCCCCCCCGGGGPKPSFAWVANRMDEKGLSFFHSVIWDKINPGIGWRFRRQHEMVMVAHKRGGRVSWPDEKRAISNVWRQSKPRDIDHPNAKPVELPQVFVEATTEMGDVVLDPFMGSGTTAIACIRTGRRFIGVEIDAGYFEIAKQRIIRELAQPMIPGMEPHKQEQGVLI